MFNDLQQLYIRGQSIYVLNGFVRGIMEAVLYDRFRKFSRDVYHLSNMSMEPINFYIEEAVRL